MKLLPICLPTLTLSSTPSHSLSSFPIDGSSKKVCGELWAPFVRFGANRTIAVHLSGRLQVGAWWRFSVFLFNVNTGCCLHFSTSKWCRCYDDISAAGIEWEFCSVATAARLFLPDVQMTWTTVDLQSLWPLRTDCVVYSIHWTSVVFCDCHPLSRWAAVRNCRFLDVNKLLGF